MFDVIYKKIQKIENKIDDVCSDEYVEPEIQNKLYEVLSHLEDLKGYINEMENLALEEDSWMDNTNIEP